MTLTFDPDFNDSATDQNDLSTSFPVPQRHMSSLKQEELVLRLAAALNLLRELF